jgi:dTMP kinase
MSAVDIVRGRFICFEGCDGAGKTTLGRRAATVLRERGFPAVFVEKRDSAFADNYLRDRLFHLRIALWDYPDEELIQDWGDFHWFHLLISWFSLWDQVRIKPLLAEAQWIIVDGWTYKYIARFLLKSNFPKNYIYNCFDHISDPETVLFLDVDPSITAVRRDKLKATESGALDGHSGNSKSDFVVYQTRVQENLKKMASEKGWNIIDGSLPESVVLDRAIEFILAQKSEFQDLTPL